MGEANRRGHYRVVYPVAERPRLVVGSHICEVLDCSERGLRFRPCGVLGPRVGDELEGRVRLLRGEEVRIQGTVLRHEPDDVTLLLRGSGIPFGAILHEQIYLRRAAQSA